MVDPQTIIPLGLLHTVSYSLQDFIIHCIADLKSCAYFLARAGLIENTCFCSCGKTCRLIRKTKAIDDYKWSCPKCTITKSIRYNSIFYHHRMSLTDTVLIIYHWALDHEITEMEAESCLSRPSLNVFIDYIRDVCRKWVFDHCGEIGGLDSSGKEKVTRITASFLVHRCHACM